MSPQYSCPKFCRLPFSGIYWLVPEAPHPALLGCGEATIESMGLESSRVSREAGLGGRKLSLGWALRSHTPHFCAVPVLEQTVSPAALAALPGKGATTMPVSLGRSGFSALTACLTPVVEEK